MNGAELLMKTAKACGVKACFANFGTTEMPLAVALAAEPEIKPVLGLFEGVCTGAADGFGRMADKPALTLLHLGPGLANGLANLHVAKKAHTPVLNLIGEHASQHVSLDPPLGMDIEALAAAVSGWYKTNRSGEELSRDVAEAYSAALYGQVATLIIPNDYQQMPVKDEQMAVPHFSYDPLNKENIEKAAQFLRSYRKAAILLGGRALRARGLRAAAQLKALTGCDLIADHLPGYMDRGAGLPEVARIPYFPEPGIELFARYEAVIIAGTKEPVSFFGYPGIRGKLLAEGQPRVLIAGNKQDPVEALHNLAELLHAPAGPDKSVLLEFERPSIAEGELNPEKACRTLAAVQPEGVVIIDEGVSSAGAYYDFSRRLPPHSLLTNSGGSIGFGIPCSIGAAVACPDRPVIDFQADGSAMYTVQALWTQAKQKLNITTLICSNRAYNILKMELHRAKINSISPGLSALLDLDNPRLDWVNLAASMGVPSASVETAEQLATEIRKSLSEPGPHLIEMVFK